MFSGPYSGCAASSKRAPAGLEAWAISTMRTMLPTYGEEADQVHPAALVGVVQPTDSQGQRGDERRETHERHDPAHGGQGHSDGCIRTVAGCDGTEDDQRQDHHQNSHDDEGRKDDPPVLAAGRATGEVLPVLEPQLDGLDDRYRRTRVGVVHGCVRGETTCVPLPVARRLAVLLLRVRLLSVGGLAVRVRRRLTVRGLLVVRLAVTGCGRLAVRS